jgi:glycosyltransferase involved in cell wall biosynthesis
LILFVRGDLRSETGWSRAIRALVAAIGHRFSKICGADLHYSPSRSNSEFGHLIVDDDMTCALLAGMANVVVLHACQPSHMRHVPGTVNVGWWFWETDRISSELDWLERLRTLDLLFVPSDWQAKWVSRLGLRAPVRILPWPHRIPDVRMTRQSSAGAIRAYPPFSRRQLEQLMKAEASGADCSDLRRELLRQQEQVFDLDGASGRYAFAVQTDAPRKGLGCLLSEWRAYCSASGSLATLLIRFSGIDVGHGAGRLLQTFSATGIAATRGDEATLGSVMTILEPLSEETLSAAYAQAAALVVASFGEGFGGPIVEAVQAGALPIAPRHTAFAQLLPERYSLAYATVPYCGPLVGQLPIQPASATWHVPEPGALAAALLRLDTMNAEERAKAWAQLSAHLRMVLSPESVLACFMAGLAAVANEPGPQA